MDSVPCSIRFAAESGKGKSAREAELIAPPRQQDLAGPARGSRAARSCRAVAIAIGRQGGEVSVRLVSDRHRARPSTKVIECDVRENLWLAFGYNALAIPIAAMSLSSVSVIANALRLRGVQLDG
jgi:hypothetical protein